MRIKIKENNCKSQSYACWDQDHIRFPHNISEIKLLPFTVSNTSEINELLRSGWIFITVFENFSILLGKIRK